jgi:hypothetical protein
MDNEQTKLQNDPMLFFISPLLVFSEASPTRITIIPIEFSVLFIGSNQVNHPNQKNHSLDNERETFCFLEIASFLAMT